jgi:lysophospholipase L1-like esterase
LPLSFSTYRKNRILHNQMLAVRFICDISEISANGVTRSEMDNGADRGKRRWRTVRKVFLMGVLALVALALIIGATLYWQARQKPTGQPVAVALGSSFAAGIGLGDRAAGSPMVCQRSRNGYPQQLARLRHLPIRDMSCSGATMLHVLDGGQALLGPQLDGLAKDTKWVTLTAGGNDVSYVGDLSFLAGRKDQTLMGWLMRQFWSGPRKAEQRDFTKLRTVLASTLAEIKRRAPQARIIVATYPTILPPKGACANLGLTEAEADQMRIVGDRLAVLTSAVAQEASAIAVDMHTLGAGHHACSAVPWVNGWHNTSGTAFHPTIAGAKATAAAISAAMDTVPNPMPSPQR